MILPLVALALVNLGPTHSEWQQEREQTAFEKLFPHPTGTNGLEDYLRAGDQLRFGSAFGTYQSWIPPERRPTPEQIKKDAEEYQKELADLTPELRKAALEDEPKISEEEKKFREHVNSLNYYQVKEEEVREFEGALNLLGSGNAKPFFYPRNEYGSLDISPFASIKAVAKLAADAAYVSFAEGQSSRATEILEESLVMAHRFESQAEISRLVSIAINAIALASLNQRMQALTPADAKRLEATATSLLEEGTSIDELIRNERQFTLAELHKAFGEMASPSANAEPDPVNQQFANLTPDQRQAWEQKIIDAVESHFETARQRFSGPEETWLAPDAETGSPVNPDGDSDTVKNLDQAAAMFADSGSSLGARSFAVTLMKSRTQLRLLRLHAQIVQYRWNWGELPSSLEDMKLPPEFTYDPINGKQFKFVRVNDWYRLSSLGIPDTGEIELKYVRPANLNVNEPPPP